MRTQFTEEISTTSQTDADANDPSECIRALNTQVHVGIYISFSLVIIEETSRKS